MDRAPSPLRKFLRAGRAGLRILLHDSRGATAIEYALIIALIVLAMIGALNTLAGVTTNMWNNVSSQVLRHA